MIALASFPALAHEETDRVSIELETADFSAGTVQLRFKLFDNILKHYVRPENLEIVHEKKLHAFLYDRALEEFQHVHPHFERGIWHLDIEINRNGIYSFWIQGTTADRPVQFRAKAMVTITDGADENSWPAVLTENRAGCDGESCLELSGEKLWAKREVMPNILFSRTDGAATELGWYLGERAHAVVTDVDGNDLIHVHPTDHGAEGQLMLHMMFPAKGMYKIWVQFLDHEVLRTIPITVEVFERAAAS